MQKLIPATCLLLLFFHLGNAQTWNRQMDLKKMRIDVKADAFTVTTFIEMEFCNQGDSEIEGLFNFQLEPGQAITAFQLDLFGKYRDGSVEEKWKATNAYNTIVGKRVDPALLKMVGQHRYSLNVYPVPAKGCRKVTMTIQQLLSAKNEKAEYKLPLSIQDIIEELEVKISVRHASARPLMMHGLLSDSMKFRADGNGYLAVSRTTNQKADKPLAFSIPSGLPQPVLCLKKNENKTLFALKLRPGIAKTYNITPKKVTVFWDVSASGNLRDIAREISFLRQYLSGNNAGEVTIISFNHHVQDTATFSITGNSHNLWVNHVRSFEYEGATQFGVLDFSKVNADVILLFSDGKNSFGKPLPVAGKTHVYCINSASSTGSPHVDKIIGQSGGQYLDLSTLPIIDALNKAGKAVNVLLNITNGGMELPLQEVLTESNIMLFLTGTLPENTTEIKLQYGNNGKVREEETIAITTDNMCDESAIDRISMLAEFESYVQPFTNWVDALYFGKNEKVVTWNTAFIVLEKLDDYIKYNITPPKELEPLCDMNQFVTADEERKRYYRQLGHLEMLTALAQSYNQRISAWDKTQALIEIKQETVQLRTNQANQGDQAKKATGSNEIPMPNNSPVLTGTEVVVTALGQTRQPKELGYSVSRVRAGELTQAKPVNLQNGLTGKVSGLNINTVNNSVFADTRITLRGIRSLTGNNQPMLILDGQPVRLELLSSINPNNILNVTILKSAAATAIYGSEAVNGVLVIQSKMGSRSGYWFSRGAYKLKNQPDVDYLEEIKQSGRRQALSCYRELRKTEGDGAGFYMDIAQYLYKKGFRKEAKVILYSAAETVRNDRQVAKAIGYILEAWKEFEEAINVYQFLLESDPNDIKAYRDLALAQYQAGKYQESVNMYYKGIMRNEAKSLHLAYGPSTKALMLQEMNAIILLHGDSLDISGIQKELIRPLYNDLRIVLDCNTNAAYNEISVVEPGGKICSYYSMKNTSGRVWGHNYYYSNNELQEYQVKEAAAGKYRIRVSYSEYIQTGVKIPTMIKITTFKNFGRSNQEILVENVIMDNQGGDVEIGEVSWNKQRTRS